MSGETRDGRGVLWSIQYLRAVAAVAVVVFHKTQDIHSAFLIGEHGVDLFFVISGFIMVKLTDGRPTTPADFALDRIARIVPPYWLATILTFALVAAGKKLWQTSSDPAHLIKSLLFIPARNIFGIFPTLTVGWTLAYEMFFYAVFALALFAKRWRVAGLAGVFGMLVTLGVVYHPQNAVAATYTSPLLLAFLAGAVLAKLPNAHRGVRLAGSVAIAGALALMNLLTGSLSYAAGSVLIVGAALFWESTGTLPKSRCFKHVGDASYAIYLFQGFGFMAADFVAAKVWQPPASVMRAGSIMAAIALGLLVFRFIEQPLTRATRSLLRRLTGRTPVLKSPPRDALTRAQEDVTV